MILESVAAKKKAGRRGVKWCRRFIIFWRDASLLTKTHNVIPNRAAPLGGGRLVVVYLPVWYN